MKKTTVARFAAVAVLVGMFTVLATTADDHAPSAEAPRSSQAASDANGAHDLALDGGMSEGRTEADASGQAPPEPALLELVASDAQGVALRFAK